MMKLLDAKKFKQIVLFEDQVARGLAFLPLSYTHSIAELRVGAFTQLERLRLVAGKIPIILDVRESHAELARERTRSNVNEPARGKSTLFLNARAFLDASMIELLNSLEMHTAVYPGEQPDPEVASFFAVFADSDSISEAKIERSLPIYGILFEGLWKMLQYNQTAIQADEIHAARMLQNFLDRENQSNFIAVIDPARVWLGRNVKIAPGVVLDCSKGPIILNDGVRIMANAVIVGPAVIGENTIVKIGAKIYEGTSIGPVCKVGGEIENSIILGYSNKQHDGYLGHSYLGEWVNLGADTNTSDLKNDYSNVKLTIEDQQFDTGSQFVGLLMGDHSKTAISTQFNTGTVVGVSCNLFGEGFPPKWIPNFSWGGAGTFEHYRVEKALAVARVVMERRDKTLTDSEAALLTALAHLK
jgi:UDP-N-acetylglucosamine diphosphorylase/glucosamine-1-phosphate N-acetyltransferase